MDLRAIGRWLLVPASIVFALRAAIAMFGGSPGDVSGLGPVTGITGALALPGIVLVWWASRKDDQHGLATLALLFVLVGHFLFQGRLAVIGPAFVYFGSGLASGRKFGVLAGGLALLGALVRGDVGAIGHGMVAFGAAGTAFALAQSARIKA